MLTIIAKIYKQQVLNARSKTILRINFIGTPDHREVVTESFVLEQTKETILDFSDNILKVV